jgi:outer membrane immunogenic protein
MRIGFVTAMALALAPTASFAQDSGSWTGGYFGAGASYLGGSLYSSNCVGLCPRDPAIAGFSVIVQGGYDHQLANSAVVGAYIDVPITGPGGSFNLGTAAAPLTYSYKPTIGVAAGARVGYAFGQFLPYAHAGLHVTGATATSPTGATLTRTHVGGQVGAGVEVKINRHLSTDFRGTYLNTFPRAYDFGGGASRWGVSALAGSASVKWRF